MGNEGEILSVLKEVRDLLTLLAIPQLKERDRSGRERIVQIIGNSAQKRDALWLIDGERTRSQIIKEAPIEQGNLSRFIADLKQAGLCEEENSIPKLVVFVDQSMFDN